MRIKKLLFPILFLSLSTNAQVGGLERKIDSLDSEEFEYLQKRYLSHKDKKEQGKALIYAKAFLKNAKKTRDSIYIMKGYYFLSNSTTYTKSTKYTDSILLFIGKRKEHQYLKTTAYFERARKHYHLGRDLASLNDYILAKKFLDKEKNSNFYATIEYSIALMLTRTGQHNKALNAYKKYHKFIVKNKNIIESNNYIISTLSLSNAYRYNNILDSAMFYSKLAIDASHQQNQKYFLYKAKVTEGIVNYELEKYQLAKDSLLKYIPLMEINPDSLDMPIAHFFLGKSYMQSNDWENALKQFKKVDTLLQSTSYFPLELRENYNLLYKYFKKKGDLRKELFYLEKLIGQDSLLYSNNTNIQNTLLTKYETPKLIREKEEVIQQLNENNDNKSKKLYLLSVISISLFVLVFYYYRKRNLYKKRFQSLLNEENSKKQIKNCNSEKSIPNIPKSIIDQILFQIKIFEEQNGFLNSHITLNSLAKSIGTNSNYLSKIINFYKDKNFSVYLSDLRIEYAIKALKTQPKLRAYTIKAIAFEVGFKNSESFTKAFYKKAGIYPSYFVKNLNSIYSKEDIV